jgi:hypothetical protein
MSMHPAPRILIVAGLCAAALVGIVLRESMARDGGVEVVLPMQAADPRDMLRGHYVTVRLSERLAPGEPCPQALGDGSWLAFGPNGATHTLLGSGATRQQALEIGPIPVEGSFTCNPPAPDGSQPGAVFADLGVDRFYINQAEAERIDRVVRTQRPGEATRAFAILSIGRDGHARLKGLLVDNQRFELNWL